MVAVVILSICGLVYLQADMMHFKFKYVVRFGPLLYVTHVVRADPQKIFGGNLHIMIDNQYFSKIYNTRPLSESLTFYQTKHNLKGISSIITNVSKLPNKLIFRAFYMCVVSLVLNYLFSSNKYVSWVNMYALVMVMTINPYYGQKPNVGL